MPRFYHISKDVFTLLPRRNTFSNANVNIIRAKENILIDTGSVFDPGINYLKKVLSSLKIETIDKIIITHSHVDHCQNLRELVEQFGAEVYAHKNAIPVLQRENFQSIEAFEFWELIKETYPWIFQSRFNWLYRRLIAMGYNRFVYGRRKKVEKITPVVENNRIGELKVIFVPGHSDDSICLLDIRRKILFTGDMIPWTPYIHTSIEDFRNSITKILNCAEQYDIKFMVRGHQKPFSAEIEKNNYRLFLEDMNIAEKRILKLLQNQKELTARQMLPYIFQRTHFIHNLLYRVLMRTQLFWIIKYLQNLENKDLIRSTKKGDKVFYQIIK